MPLCGEPFCTSGRTNAFQSVYIQVCSNVLPRLNDLPHSRRSRRLSRKTSGAGHAIIFQFRGNLGPLSSTYPDVIHVVHLLLQRKRATGGGDTSR
jgi:hypothetical protein